MMTGDMHEDRSLVVWASERGREAAKYCGH